MLYENKISAQIQERNDPSQSKPSAKTWLLLEILRPLSQKNQLLSDICNQKITNTWTSDRLAEVQGAKVTVRGGI